MGAGGMQCRPRALSSMPRLACPCLQTHPLNHSTSVDPASFDVVVVNTIVTAHWLRHQVEAWGLPFLRKTVW